MHTSQKINDRIQRKTENNILYYAKNPQKIDERLEELNREWDIERALEINAATITLISMFLGVISSRKWFFVPALVGGFLLQHAIQGWSPPLPLLRRLGMRTQTEIERERYALKALRGDFGKIGNQAAGEEDLDQLSSNISEAVRH